MSNAPGGTGRIPRERATAHVVELLEHVCAGEGAAACVTAVYAFGSWSRGALEVGDVDLEIEYDRSRDPETARQMLDLLVAGRDWNSPLRKALEPR
jgi:predicted nucleotidyltransferase